MAVCGNRTRNAAIALLTVSISSCRDALRPELPSGVYQLVRFEGQSLPYDYGPMPTKGTVPTCSLLLAEGRMQIFRELGTFYMSYDYRNGCTQEFMSSVATQGQFVVHGNMVLYRITASDGAVFEAGGRITSSTISYDNGQVYLFSRARADQ